MRRRSDDELQQVRAALDSVFPADTPSREFVSDDAVRLALVHNTPAEIHTVLDVVTKDGVQLRAVRKALYTGLRCFNLGKRGLVLP